MTDHDHTHDEVPVCAECSPWDPLEAQRSAGDPPLDVLTTGTIFFDLIFTFQQGVFQQYPLNLLIQFNGRHLQQFDGLLQLRGKRQMLREFELETGFHGLHTEVFAQVHLPYLIVSNNVIRGA